ncbi:hypothetical protein [Aurantiacibacter sp. MUD61]|uniref:hypothetical protein n=1 Tax=Aurantiacibacter sp. MUD61 TaxID=3009083 RepID=UPI0022F0B4FA|nr:hypothetical protein [Aurantiacibacter sp. MUD61]
MIDQKSQSTSASFRIGVAFAALSVVACFIAASVLSSGSLEAANSPEMVSTQP